MAAPGPRSFGRSRMVTLIMTLGVVLVIAGGAMLATNVVNVSGAATTTTLSLATSAAGATCNDANPSAPVCSGLAGGDVMAVTGTGFTPGSTASIVQCSSDPSQPVLFFLGQDIPVSCSPLALTTISSKGKTKGHLSGTHTMATGTVGPPVNGVKPTCTQTTPATSVITGCSTSGTAATDAANYPCPPTATQQAAGVTCVLAIGDTAGDRAVGTVLFGTETLPTSTTTTLGSTSTTGATSSTTGATTSSTTSMTSTTSTTSSTTTTTSPTSTATATQVSVPSVTLGPSGSVSDTVTVRGTPTHGSPAGDVTFYVCQTGTTDTLTPGSCAATINDHLATVVLTSGSNNTASASSGTFIPPATGTWCFSAVYGGSATYTGSADNTSSTNLDSHECALVNPSPSTTATFISSADVTLGASGSVTDLVTVGGNVIGGSPTGIVTFYVCHTGTALTPTVGPCPGSGAPEATEALVAGAGDTAAAASSTFVPTSVGTWCFSVVYSGSSTYAATTDNTGASNLDSNECVLVGAPPGDAITSDPNVSANAGVFSAFTITTSGSPTPVIKKTGKLPRGLAFVKNHNGTATITGTPKAKKSIGVYHLTITAIFGKGKAKVVVTQALVLTVA